MQPGAREESLPEATARWLVTDGRPWVDALALHPTGGSQLLADIARLRRDGLDEVQAAAVVAAASARRRLAPALAAAGWDDHVGLLLSAAAAEQASHPVVARHRAQRFAAGREVFDLGCGAGIDAISLALSGAQVTAVDLDPARLVLAEHNAASAGVAMTTMQADATTVPLPPDAWWHADPSRRLHGRRARTLGDTGPPSAAILAATSRQQAGALVMSPGVSWEDPDLPAGEIEFIQVDGKLTEAVAWLGELRTADVAATATRLSIVDATVEVDQLLRIGPAPEVPVGPVGAWLLDPAPAAARSRVHHQLIADLDGRRIASTRALCTADIDPRSPWWTAWEVEAVLPGRPRAVRSWLRGRDELPLSIELHGPQLSLASWWRGIGTVPQGPRGRRIHVVQMPEGVRAVVTRHASLSHPGPQG